MTPISSISFTIEDNLESIFDTLKKSAIAHRDGHAISINFSHIRPRGDIISSVQKPSEGPSAFLKIFDNALRSVSSMMIKEDPNVAILTVDHPDILEFLSYESQFSIKIAVTQKFIQAVENDEMYDLVDPRTGNETNKLSARNVYDLISDKTSSNEHSGILYPQESSPRAINKPTIGREGDPQGSLPFNESVLAEEIIPPPVITVTT